MHCCTHCKVALEIDPAGHCKNCGSPQADTDQAVPKYPPAPGDYVCLQIVGTDGLKSWYLCSRTTACLGRSRSAEFPISPQDTPHHLQASGRHARLFWNNGWYVEDLGSKNKTRIQGMVLRPQDPYPLRDDDVLILGDSIRLLVGVYGHDTLADAALRIGYLDTTAPHEYLLFAGKISLGNTATCALRCAGFSNREVGWIYYGNGYYLHLLEKFWYNEQPGVVGVPLLLQWSDRIRLDHCEIIVQRP